MARIILFDLNETLLDPSVLDRQFKHVFGSSAARVAWLKQTIEFALVATITDAYVPFEALQRASLEVMAAQQGLTLSEKDAVPILDSMRSLPPYPDVRPALDFLRAEGLHLAILTNSSISVMTAQLDNADLAGYFLDALSVESVRRFKPDAEVYRMAARSLGVSTADLRLVAAHAWDLAGALRAGCAVAFVARPGKVLNPLLPQPNIAGADLRAVARQIVEVELGVPTGSPS